MANWAGAETADAPRPREGMVHEINALREQLQGIAEQLDIFDRTINGQPRHDPPGNLKLSAVQPAGLPENIKTCRDIASAIYGRLQGINEKF